MDTTGDDAVADVEDFIEPDDDSAAGEDMAADSDPTEGDSGTSGLPPEGDDPNAGEAGSG